MQVYICPLSPHWPYSCFLWSKACYLSTVSSLNHKLCCKLSRNQQKITHLPDLHVKSLSISSKSCQTPSVLSFRGCEAREFHYHIRWHGGKRKVPPCLPAARAPQPEHAIWGGQKYRGRFLQQVGFRLLNDRNRPPGCVLWLE